MIKKLGLRADDTRKLKIIAPIFFIGGLAESVLFTAFMSLFNARVGVESLPSIYMIEAVILPFEAWLLAFLSSRLSKPSFMRVLYACMISITALNGLLLIAIALLQWDVTWYYWVLFISSNFVVRQLMIMLWSLAVDLLPTQQSKRLMPIFITVTTVGGIISGLLAMVVSRLGGTETVYMVSAVLLLLAAPSLWKAIQTYLVPRMLKQMPAHGEETQQPMRALLGEAIRKPYVLVTIAIMTLMPALYFVMEYEYLTLAERRYPNEADLTAFFGLITAIQFTAVLVIQSFSSRLLQWLGAGNTIAAIALLYMLSFGAAAVFIDSAAGLIVISLMYLLVTLLIDYYAEPSFPLFFKMIPLAYRDGIRYFAQGLATSGGIFLGALLQMLHSGGTVSLTVLSVIGAGFAFLMIVFAWFVRTLYTKELLASIKVLQTQTDEIVSSFFGGLRNLRAVEAVASLLNDANKLVRELALQMMAGAKQRTMLPRLLEQLKDPYPRIRIAALRAITLEGADIQELVQVAACLDDEDADVRVEGIKLLGRAKHLDHQAHYFIRMKLLDRHPAVQAEAVISLYRLQSEMSYGACDEALDQMLETGGQSTIYACRAIGECKIDRYADQVIALLADSAASVRCAAVECLGKLQASAAVGKLLELFPNADKEMQRVTLEALTEMGETSIDTLRNALESKNAAVWRAAAHAYAPLASDHEVKHELVESGVAQIDRLAEHKRVVHTLITAGEHELAYIAHQRYEEIRSTVFDGCWSIMERLTDVQIVQTVRGALADPDQDTRENGLELLAEGLGDRKLATVMLAAIQAWDEWESFEVEHAAEAIRETAEGDGDDWLKQIAREALRRGEGRKPMVETNQSLLETIVFLKQVSMFSELSLEELGLIAGIAEEAVFTEQSYIIRKGEVHSALYVIMEGHVEISSSSTEGWEGTIGVLGPKQYFGDTTVLSKAASTVTAQALFQDVRALVLKGEELTRLIRLYPEIGIGLLNASSTRVRQLETMLMQMG